MTAVFTGIRKDKLKNRIRIVSKREGRERERGAIG